MTDGSSGTSTVQLGCGTLIGIAIIVMIFSGGRGSSQLKSEIRELQQKIDRLELKIDDMSRKLDGVSSAMQGSRTGR